MDLKIMGESRLGGEVSATLWNPSYWTPSRVGEGQPVLTIPGFGAGDASLNLLNGYLRQSGFWVEESGIWSNIGCSEQTSSNLQLKLDRLYNQSHTPVWLIGHSRGGLFAKVLAQRNPDRVAGAISLGTPFLNPMGNMSSILLWDVALMSFWGNMGISGLPSSNCLDPEFAKALASKGPVSRGMVQLLQAQKKWDGPDSCCYSWWRELQKPVDLNNPPIHSFYSETDGVVQYQACLLPGSVTHQVHSSHCGLAANLAVMQQAAEVMSAA